MKRTRHTPEQIVTKLREADAMLAAARSSRRRPWCWAWSLRWGITCSITRRSSHARIAV